MSVGDYTSVFFTDQDAGVFGGAGTSESRLDVSALGGGTGYVCFRYSGDFDWYAHVDNVTVNGTGNGCNTDIDADGIADDIDNCINVPNPQQIDSNGDNIGNVCDGDIAGPDGPGADDCMVNFFDLDRMKTVFFSNDSDADLVGPGNAEPDGSVNFIDLARMKAVFFAPPGPSAKGCN